MHVATAKRDGSGAAIFFPRHSLTSQDGVPAGDIWGTLRRQGGCLVVVTPAGEGYVALWPETATLKVSDGSIAVVDAGGSALAEVGAEIHVGGGAYQRSDIGFVEELISDEVPSECSTGGFWLVSEVLN